MKSINKCREGKYFTVSCVILIHNVMKCGGVSLLRNFKFSAECIVSLERSSKTRRELNWTRQFRVSANGKFVWRKRR